MSDENKENVLINKIKIKMKLEDNMDVSGLK